jgi:hypothetical protein
MVVLNIRCMNCIPGCVDDATFSGRVSSLKKPIIMKPLLFIGCTIFLFTLVTFGQEADHVYLKTGSVIRGNIMEIEPANHVKIEDMCGNIWFYPMDQVAKITSEPFEGGATKKGSKGFESGFVNMTSIGFLAGSSSNNQVAPFSLLMVSGWRNSFGLFTGAGIGIEFLSTNYLPLFADLRYDLPGKDIVPYLVAKGGYSLPLQGDYSEYDIDYSYSGGALAAAGVGLKIRTREHFAWDIELMYRYQETSYTEKYSWNNQKSSYTDIYNRIEIRLGFYID